MSAKIYRLLRNNKEEGPFTSEEIIQKNLKPYDLIWIDGRSTAWSYPGELTEFKNYAPLPGENPIINYSKPQTTISPSVQAAIAVNDSIAQTAKQKPRYKVSAAWSKIQTITTPLGKDVIASEPKSSPKKMVEAQHAESLQVKPLSWKEAWLDWEKEKTIPAAEPFKAQPAKNKTDNKKSTPVLETKYVESLDSLKDKYIENVLQQKKRNKSFSFGKASEFILPALAMIIIFSAAYWLLHNTDARSFTINKSSAQPTTPVASNAKIPEANANELNANSVINTNNNAASQTHTQPVADKTQNTSATSEPAIVHAEDRKLVYAHPVKYSQSKQTGSSRQPNESLTQKNLPSKLTEQKSITKLPVQTANVTNNNVAKNNDASPPNTNTKNKSLQENDNTAEAVSSPKQYEQPAVKPVSVKTPYSYITVPQHIAMTNGVANIKIENVSDINLDLVVIDVQYFDAANRFKKGETFYLHNLKAGRNVIIKTPKDNDSFYATSKVSLVSSDTNKVYVIGDN